MIAERVSVLTAREAVVARRVWRDRWLEDVANRARVESELGRELAASLIDRARTQADRWWGDDR